jgi:hypothetical protein
MQIVYVPAAISTNFDTVETDQLTISWLINFESDSVLPVEQIIMISTIE